MRDGGQLTLRGHDGWSCPLDVARWSAVADAADLALLRRCDGPVLDIGCGPGRLVEALGTRGHRALGIDINPGAVEATRLRGCHALRRSVFDRVPGAGRWGTALLIDGNIGIGGEPRTLLRRVARLVRPGGLLLAEAAPGEVDERRHVRLDAGSGAPGPAFPWARLGARALRREATAAGWACAETWTHRGRVFLTLTTPTGPG
nr:methyltransferase domain-containing protein [Streptomyces boncukensis]